MKKLTTAMIALLLSCSIIFSGCEDTSSSKSKKHKKKDKKDSKYEDKDDEKDLLVHNLGAGKVDGGCTSNVNCGNIVLTLVSLVLVFAIRRKV